VTSPDLPGSGEPFGKVEVDVVPNAQGFAAAVRRDLDAQSQAAGQHLGRQIAAPVGRQVSASITSGIRDAGRQVPRQADAMAHTFGDKFNTTLADGISKTLKGLPKVKLGADSTDLDKQAAHIRKELEGIASKRIGVDLDPAEAIAKIQLLRQQASALARQIEKLKAEHPDVQIDTNAVAVMAQLTAVHAELKSLAREHATPQVEPQVDQGAFAVKLRAALDAANKSLPDIRPGVDASPAEEKIAEIKARIAALGDAHIGVDMDAAAANAEIVALIAELKVLKRSAKGALDFDIGQATGELVAVNSELTGTTASALAAAGAMKVLDFAASGVAIKFGAMIAVGGLIVAVLVPALAAIVPILGAIGVGVAVAAGAFGVLIAGMAPIISAYMALGKAQTAQGRSAAKSVQNTEAVADAERNAARARVAAARQIQQADQQIADARKNVGVVAKQVAADEQAAAQRTRDAYAAVKQATLDVAAAQQAVNDAREQARRDEEDLASQIAHNAEDQRQNTLDLAEAQKTLNEVLANPASTKAQREQAQLNYDRLTTQNSDLQTQQQRLAEAKTKQDRQGIEGSDGVVAAKQAELKAEQELAARRQAYAKAQQDQVKAEQDGAAKIAAARQDLAKTESDAAYQRVQAAQQVADAERAVTRAQQQQNVALAGTSSAADDAAKKLAKLSPAAASLVKYLRSLDFTDLLKAAQGFAGPLESGLKRFLGAMMPTLVSFATQVSAAIGGAMQILLTEFSSPYWQDFLKWLAGITAQALPGFAKAMVLVAHIVAGLLKAFGPIAGKVGQGFLDILTKIAVWADNLGQSKGFQDFIDYAMKELPKLGALLKAAFDAIKNIIVALAPIGDWALGFFTDLFNYIAGIDTGTLTTILGFLIGGAAAISGLASVAKVITVLKTVGGAIKGIAGFLGLLPAAEGAAAAGAEGMGAAFATALGPIALIIAAVVAIGAGLVLLYKKNQAFHDFVDRTWKAIAGFVVMAWQQYILPALKAIGDWITTKLVPVLLWLWNNVVVPVFQGIWEAIKLYWGYIQLLFQLWWAFMSKVLAPVFVWLWQNVIAPAFAGIWAVIQANWAAIQVVLQAIWDFITNVLAPIFVWLWQNVIAPAFQGIWAVIQGAWAVIQVVLQAVWDFITNVLAPIFVWLWHNVLEPVWQGIQATISIAWGVIRIIFALIRLWVEGVLIPIFLWLWHQVIEPVFAGIWAAIKWAWGFISGVFQAIWSYISGTLGPIFTWFRDHVITPVWNTVTGIISGAWDTIKGIFDTLGNYISVHVAPLFSAGVKAIGEAWKAIESAAKEPVRFVVDTVINHGIIDTLRQVAKFLNVTDFSLAYVNLPRGFAVGGPVRGPGTTTSDSILARLSDDEHVWTAAEVAAIGGHDNMLKLRRAALAGRLSELAGFAAGGPVHARPAFGTDGLPGYADGGGVFGWIGDKAKSIKKVVSDFAGAAMDAVHDPKKFLTDLAAKFASKIPFQDTAWFQLMAGIPKRITDLAVATLQKLIGTFKSTPGDTKPWTGTLSPDPLLKSMQEWALGQRGKTYLFSAVGPDRYDCSGLVGDLWGMATGNPLYHRYFSTADMGAGKYGMQSGPGRFTIYLKRGRHTAANIDGLHAEAYHGNGTPLAIGHVGTKLSYFDEVLHLPGLAGGGPISGSILNAPYDERLRAFLKYGWPEPGMSFDSGGLLHDTRGYPGQVMPIYHGSATPDAVLTDQQWSDMHALAQQAARAGTRGGLHIDNYHEHGADAAAVARDLDWLARGLG
jgi:phage-related protein